MEDIVDKALMRISSNATMSAIATVLTCVMRMRCRRKSVTYHHGEGKKQKIESRDAHICRVFSGYSHSCRDYIRMRPHAFENLVSIMRGSGLLRDSRDVKVEEQLLMFLNVLGHKTKNRIVRSHFIRSGETISRYFNKCLEAVGCIRGRFLKQAPMELAPEIASNHLYYPYFKDCIGMIDGTHIDAMLPASLVARFRGRKGVTQNVLAACTPNKLFSYVLAGWEGSANDYRVLQDALSRPQPHGLRVYDGKYYLCDAGYTTMPGFISPYRGVRYHLNEHRGRPINNRRELFNLRHSSLRSKIESTFGLLKNRFKILTAKPHYPFPTQVDIVLACAILHNYIAIVDLGDDLLNEDITIDDDDVEIATEGEDANLVDFSQNVTQREERDSRNEWKEKRDDIASAMWLDYCNKYRGGDTTEIGL
ncbi:uncharacterized protein LOC109841820 [Asparagus officinalis]|uniref:uncharacterized protein LOC109841820 n=1 Tax=Asparagus officinalis TaxID=4686 RepID=UPI00098E821C|nr:uncharacterized protein LOC109841820 [Asparagus officinalis]